VGVLHNPDVQNVQVLARHTLIANLDFNVFNEADLSLFLIVSPEALVTFQIGTIAMSPRRLEMSRTFLDSFLMTNILG